MRESLALTLAPIPDVEPLATGLDCECDGEAPWCAVCVATVALRLRHEHPLSVSVAMLRRRIPGLSGREGALLLGIMRHIPDRAIGETLARDMAVQEEERRERRRAAAPLEPEPDDPPVVLAYREAETLALVRRQPGITRREIAAVFGLALPTVGTRLALLVKGGHIHYVRGGRHPRYYPSHDRRIGKVRPHSPTRFKGSMH